MQFRFLVKFFSTFLIAVLAYELIAIALPLMNKPSDLAFYGGALLLAVTVAGTFTVLRLMWRRRNI